MGQDKPDKNQKTPPNLKEEQVPKSEGPIPKESDSFVQSDHKAKGADQEPEPAGQGDEKPAVAQKSAGKILLIEDDPPMVKMYSTKLQQEGFEVEVAYDGDEGLAKVKTWPPDLILLDLMIPKIGGMDLLERLQADPKTKNLPVVILSNLSQEQDIQRSRQLGVKEFLVKANFTPGQVVEKIKNLLKN